MSAPGLVVVTTNYPFTYTGGETMFVAPEVERLAREFGMLTVAPLHAQGERLAVPAGVAVDLALAQRLRRERVTSHLAALLDRSVWPEFARALRRGGWTGLARVWRWAAIARVTGRWARSAFAADEPCLFYTYWRGGSTLALARFAAGRGACGVVTRVHRYELYEDAFAPPFQPWHPAMYASLRLTATISRHGLDYLRAAGVDPARSGLYRLGTEALGRVAAASIDGVLRVVSCSHVSAVKRVPLIAEVLSALARRHAGQRFEWIHFGDGPEMARVQAALAAAPGNLAVTLCGHVANELVRRHYREAPVDAFVLLSDSEGLPVSIQEAASAGVPVIATDVGGVGELVGDDNGVLLAADCSVEAAVVALERVLLDADATRREGRRAASLRRWREGFDAETNHTRFAQRLHELLNELTAAPNDRQRSETA
ncbi:MAG TPA: glycosyltransferase [Burkholderiaceae bacterium]